ncbi:squalene cyclase [Sinomonas sp. JGH33]|uniref:Squalene cyclase n=1 Tax=Sinomonas terricola TaxID=3110330 RepID=A0ABU5TAP2_9MICC|nr:squalene cyclase [Sinomonas sp. JGH33]MEA5456186.1 squalene cyclase [Sinomonas sp. JGH33]
MIVAGSLAEWLLDTDPALRWQVERDLLGAPPAVWQATRRRVATEGFGARLLALQDPDGQWDGGAYFPGDFDFHGPEAAEGAGQPWTATTWSLNALREWGLDASALAGTAERLSTSSRWEYNQGPYWDGEVDCCINAYTLANGAWLGADVTGLAAWLEEHQLDDGGWNCEWVDGSVRSSFHSTLNTLIGLLDYERTAGASEGLRAARTAGEEYLLERRLLYRKTTGEIVAPWVPTLAYPFRWRYSALRAVDYFRAASLQDGTPPDPRVGEAVELVRSARQDGGTWIQEQRFPGRAWFEADVPPGQPSPWLTFYGTRALAWWDGAC